MNDQHQPDPAAPAPPDGWTPAAGGAAAPPDGWQYPQGGAHPHAGPYPPGGAYPPAGQYPPGGAYPPGAQYPQGGGYGPPPPGWGPAAAAGYPPPGAGPDESRSSGAAVTALVLGCSALLLAFLPFVGLLGVALGVAAVALGVVGVRKARAGAGGRGLAVGGIATGAVSVLLGVAVTAGTVWFIDNGGVFGGGWLDEEWDLGVGWEMDRYERARVDNAPLLRQYDPFVADDVTYRLREVDLDADEEVLGVSRWASHPEGRYVLVDVDITYDGPYTFDVGDEIYAFAFDDEARAYSDACMGPGPTAWDHDPLERGETVLVQLCFDVPVDRVDRLSLVMDPWALEGDPGVWDLSPDLPR